MSSFWNSPAWTIAKRSTSSKKENIPNPGPGNYNSSGNIGKHAPGWKIGGASRDTDKVKEVPGPGEYNISTGKSGLKITMSSKPKVTSLGDGITPGPGNYNTSGNAVYKNPSAFTMGAKYGASKIEDPQPGPGSYSLNAEFKQTGAKIGKSKRAGGLGNENPGPGQYGNSRPFSAGPKYGFGNEMKGHSTLDQRPGPGQYEITDTALSKFKGCVIGQKFSKKNQGADVPGPGCYEISSKRPMSGAKIGKSERNKNQGSAGPGPGAYDFGYKPKGSTEVKIGTAQRGFNSRAETPGPGAYELAKKEGKGVSISGFKGKSEIEITPGPGTYDVRGQLQRPCSAKIGKGVRSNFGASDTPGPGQYFPKEGAGWHFAFSKEPRSKEIKGGDPGPGYYEIPATVPSAPHYLLDPSIYKSYQ